MKDAEQEVPTISFKRAGLTPMNFDPPQLFPTSRLKDSVYASETVIPPKSYPVTKIGKFSKSQHRIQYKTTLYASATTTSHWHDVTTTVCTFCLTKETSSVNPLLGVGTTFTTVASSTPDAYIHSKKITIKVYIVYITKVVCLYSTIKCT